MDLGHLGWAQFDRKTPSLRSGDNDDSLKTFPFPSTVILWYEECLSWHVHSSILYIFKWMESKMAITNLCLSFIQTRLTEEVDVQKYSLLKRRLRFIMDGRITQWRKRKCTRWDLNVEISIKIYNDFLTTWLAVRCANDGCSQGQLDVNTEICHLQTLFNTCCVDIQGSEARVPFSVFKCS